MNIGYQEGNHGEKSSKRLNATILIWTAVFIAFVSCMYSLFWVVPGAKFIEIIVGTLLIAGTGLNAATLLEKGVSKFRDSK